MPEPRVYATAEAFRRALEDRLTLMSRTQGIDLTRLRRMVAFERLLARLFTGQRPPWVLKGGYAMEMRFRQSARATKDIDLSLPELRSFSGGEELDGDKLLSKLAEAAAVDLGDWFTFRVGTATDELAAQPYGGFRFPVEAQVDERKFTAFHFDVALGDAIVSEPEWVTGHELLTFAGIAPAKIALLPREQQFAEKVHAYTLPREGTNSRTRDLVDMVLLVQSKLPEPGKVREAVQATFKRRKTHPVPAVLLEPAADWAAPYQRIAEDVGLEAVEMGAAFAIVRDYWAGLDFMRED